MPSRSGPPSVGGRWAARARPRARPHPPGARPGRGVPRTARRAHPRRAGHRARRPAGSPASTGCCAAMEDSGRARRGYVVEGLGAAQFAVPGAIDRLRALSRPTAPRPVQAGRVAATPAGGHGRRRLGAAARAVSPGWSSPPPTPRSPTARRCRGPPRSATPSTGPDARPARWSCWSTGAPALYVERGGRSLLSFTAERDELVAAAAGTGRARCTKAGWARWPSSARTGSVAGLGAGRGAHRSRVPGHAEGAAAARLSGHPPPRALCDDPACLVIASARRSAASADRASRHGRQSSVPLPIPHRPVRGQDRPHAPGEAATLGLVRPTARVRLLGRFALRIHDAETETGTEIPLDAARAEQLVAYLVLHPDAQPRRRLAAALWPDSTEAQAHTNLRKLLHTAAPSAARRRPPPGDHPAHRGLARRERRRWSSSSC